MRAARRRSKICGVLRRRRRASVPKGGAKFAGQCAAEHVRREEVRGDVAQRDGAAAAEQARHKEARDSPHNGPVLWSMRDAMRCEKMLHDARVQPPPCKRAARKRRKSLPDNAPLPRSTRAMSRCEMSHNAPLPGHVYSEGWGRVREDGHAAVEWWHKAAEQGLAVAQFYLGFLYKGGDEDKRSAIEWPRKAAEYGDALAQCDLGASFSNESGRLCEDKLAMG
ncbi:Secretory immunoglobulin A-binding protein EsiB [Porphyridium purpureum]|nr:Secretory immunoglobulin A-binding protein EsiB [Porphyridium purpureum]|eukprot:POR1091..scf208_2